MPRPFAARPSLPHGAHAREEAHEGNAVAEQKASRVTRTPSRNTGTAQVGGRLVLRAGSSLRATYGGVASAMGGWGIVERF